MITEGSKWTDGKGKFFRVLNTVEIDGHSWVHYREDLGITVPTKECKEFSCYEESFVIRFTQQSE